MRQHVKSFRLAAVGVSVSLGLAAVLVSAGTTTSLASQARTTPKLIIGVLHPASTKDAGYNQAQEAGITYLESHMAGIKVLEAQNIEGAPQDTYAMKSMINKGAKLIFPMAFNYQSDAYAVAHSNPKIVFEQPGGYLTASNFGDYWAASDDVNYALGVAAAKMSKTGKLGFIGAQSIPTVICAAIAFHLGARSVNPKITTTVIFTGNWVDPVAEATAVNTLHSDRVDVVADLVDSPITIIKTAGKDHMFVVGYHSATGEKYAVNWWLSAVAFNWGPMLVNMAKAVENGTWKKSAYHSNYVAPVQSLTAYMGPFGPKVTTAAKNAAIASFKLYTSGKRLNPFKGPIYNQSGKLVVAAGKYLSNAQQQSVYWFARGMIGKP
jgi:basic membrane lipoprotein Med (substrate-binding protein (PBP1-ABC) superfamily)